jgi:hypothetical protein
MITFVLSVTLFLFTAIILMHAVFVGYGAGPAETQPQFRATQDKAGQKHECY